MNEWINGEFEKLNTASVGNRGRWQCCTFHYCQRTVSIKPRQQFPLSTAFFASGRSYHQNIFTSVDFFLHLVGAYKVTVHLLFLVGVALAFLSVSSTLLALLLLYFNLHDTANHNVNKTSTVTGLQLRNSEQNCFHANYLISQPNPMMWPSLKSSIRDDSNER